jgi:putative ABC transport system permease protein
MKIRTDVKENFILAVTTIWEHKVRSALTLLGVIVGTMTVVAVGSVLTGMTARVGEITEKFGPNVAFVTKYDAIGPRFSQMDKSERNRKNLVAEDAEAIASLPSVYGTTPEIRLGSFGPAATQPVIKFRGIEYSRPIIFGHHANYPELQNVELLRGRWFTPNEDARRVEVVIIPEATLESLFGTLDPIDKTIELDGREFRVIGVRARGVGGLFGGDGADDRFFYIPYGTLEKMHPELDDISITIRAKDGQLLRMFDETTELLRRRRGVRVGERNDFSINTPDAIFESIGQITGVLALVVVPLSAVGLIVGGVGVMNIMLMSVTERTKEIGVRRAVGARRKDIIWQFLVEAVTLTALGGLLGIVVGWLISTVVHLAVPSIPSSVPTWAVVTGMAVSIGVGLVFGLWPAVKAARLDPIDALRYE